MIRSLILSSLLTFGFSINAMGAQPETETGVQKKQEKTETPTEQDQKAEADAALKKVEALTKEARGDEKKEDKEKKKK